MSCFDQGIPCCDVYLNINIDANRDLFVLAGEDFFRTATNFSTSLKKNQNAPRPSDVKSLFTPEKHDFTY